MKLIVCVDDKGGMLFNNRRQSADRMVVKRIMELTEHHKLWMNHYSSMLFDFSDRIIIDDCVSNAGSHDYCFIEDQDPTPLLSDCEEIVIFCWNRLYPSDLFFPVTFVNEKWCLLYKEEFSGNSHDRITMEVYRP